MKINEQQLNLIKQRNESSRINKANTDENKTSSVMSEQATENKNIKNVDYKAEVRSQNLMQHNDKITEDEAKNLLNEIMSGLNSMSAPDAEAMVGNINRDNIFALLRE
ncbi:MAG: hypothetical protein QMC67_13985 [Candidatus Wallbacteria bacterium]